MTPLLSIVTGTFGRLDYLRAFVKSCRQQIPFGMDTEYVIVDAGSIDGTIDWCAEQPDVVFIQQGKKLGAIRAFDAGAEAAHSEYVMLGNDDILVADGAILRALVHLETHPNCGGVAFADNRPAPGYEKPGYHVQTIHANNGSGRVFDVPYAQVGMFRRWLGAHVGWWGSRDPLMGTTHTYGGDSYLSARIWECGYTIDPVAGAAVNDRLALDALRSENQATEQRIGSAFYRRYPNGVSVGSQPKPGNPNPDERMRILYLPLFSPGFGRYKRGLFEALSGIGLVAELDYLRERGRFVRLADCFQPHVILTQLHDAHTITPSMLANARVQAPGAVVVNWDGDVYLDQLTAPDILELLKHVDLQTVVNADALPIYKEAGLLARYWQIGFEPVSASLPEAKTHDLLYMANAYSPSRKLLAATLRELDPKAGLYGYGWDELGASGNTFYDFSAGAALYRNCKIAIGDNQYKDKAFVSNRLFEALANGAFLLHQHIPGIEELTGIIPNVHFVEWTDLDDLRVKIRHWLAHHAPRRQIAEAGQAFVRANCSFEARVRELFEKLIPEIPVDEPSPELGSDDGSTAVANLESADWTAAYE